MIKIVLDTGVLISNIGGFRSTDISRDKIAKVAIDFLMNNPTKYGLYYSERTKGELINFFERNGGSDLSANNELKKYTMLHSHIFNESLDQISIVWENIASKWGDNSEYELGESLEMKLPDKVNKLNRNDRGIIGDAIMNSCNAILHENPKDFRKLEEISKENGILMLNLLELSSESVISILEKLKPE